MKRLWLVRSPGAALFMLALIMGCAALPHTGMVALQNVPNVGAAIEISISHASPVDLMIGILFPRPYEKAGIVSIYVHSKTEDPHGIELAPKQIRKCKRIESEATWYGGCQTFEIASAGKSRVVLTFPYATLLELEHASMDRIGIGIVDMHRNKENFYAISLLELLQKSRVRFI